MSAGTAFPAFAPSPRRGEGRGEGPGLARDSHANAPVEATSVATLFAFEARVLSAMQPRHQRRPLTPTLSPAGRGSEGRAR